MPRQRLRTPSKTGDASVGFAWIASITNSTVAATATMERVRGKYYDIVM